MIPQLRAAQDSDLPAILQIERDSFPQPHWDVRDFLRFRCTVADVEDRLAGFIVVRETFAGDQVSRAEREILNLATAVSFRQAGIATFLLRQELQSGAMYFLEVRESNSPAQALYRKFGFVEISRRKKYYRNPTETAIVMQMK